MTFARNLRRLVVRAAPQLLLALLVVALLAVQPSALAPDNVRNVLVNAAPVAVLGLGAMWVLVSGGLDLSAGYGVAMCALILGARLQDGASLPEALAWTLAAAALLGLANGVLVGVVGIPAFIATLATMVSVQGVSLILGQVGTVIVADALLTRVGTGSLLGVPAPVVYALVVALLVGAAARFTRFGLRTYAVGSNRDAAAARGVPLVRQYLGVYLFGAALTCAAAVLLAARVQIVTPNIAGISLLLDAFAATILGGTSLFGGRGSVTGTVTGAVTISLITTSLVTLGASAESVQLLKGVMIVVAVVVDAFVRTLERRETGATVRTVGRSEQGVERST